MHSTKNFIHNLLNIIVDKYPLHSAKSHPNSAYHHRSPPYSAKSHLHSAKYHLRSSNSHPLDQSSSSVHSTHLCFLALSKFHPHPAKSHPLKAKPPPHPVFKYPLHFAFEWFRSIPPPPPGKSIPTIKTKWERDKDEPLSLSQLTKGGEGPKNDDSKKYLGLFYNFSSSSTVG